MWSKFDEFNEILSLAGVGNEQATHSMRPSQPSPSVALGLYVFQEGTQAGRYIPAIAPLETLAGGRNTATDHGPHLRAWLRTCIPLHLAYVGSIIIARSCLGQCSNWIVFLSTWRPCTHRPVYFHGGGIKNRIINCPIVSKYYLANESGKLGIQCIR